MANDVNETLEQRGATHGDFAVNAEISQQLRAALHLGNYVDLHPVQREALDMICHKMARICSGNPDEKDHWHDIAGYATLAERWLSKGENSWCDNSTGSDVGAGDIAVQRLGNAIEQLGAAINSQLLEGTAGRK